MKVLYAIFLICYATLPFVHWLPVIVAPMPAVLIAPPGPPAGWERKDGQPIEMWQDWFRFDPDAPTEKRCDPDLYYKWNNPCSKAGLNVT